jgi:hypothetical protein
MATPVCDSDPALALTVDAVLEQDQEQEQEMGLVES